MESLHLHKPSKSKLAQGTLDQAYEFDLYLTVARGLSVFSLSFFSSSLEFREKMIGFNEIDTESQ